MNEQSNKEKQSDILINQKCKKRFAEGFCFHKFFWVFFIACFLGVVIETIFCFITSFTFVNRTGLVYGPFNLVYGFGAVVMTAALYWLRGKRDFVVFLWGALIGTVYEFACSWLQEVAFGTVSWEYSEMPFNLNGRVNLLYSIFWGILALVWVKEIYPRMSKLIEKIPKKYGYTLTWILIVFMVINTIVSGIAVLRMTQRRENIAPQTFIGEFIDKRFPDERLEKIYPSMMYADEARGQNDKAE